VLNGRHYSLIARNVLRPSNYVALARIGRVYERPFQSASRYFFGQGQYPCSVRLRTPTGVLPVTVFSSHDAITVHEIFCRGDYRCEPPPQVVVDLGSNIGISALYFLTRSSSAYCELYEPDPRNIERLLSNLEAFRGRFTLHECAVADTQGVMPFVREPTGRYGSIDAVIDDSYSTAKPDDDLPPGAEAERLSVRVEHINTVLEQAISRHGAVDLLKVDTEGSELVTVQAIDPRLRAHVRNIVIEWWDHDVKLDGCAAASTCDTIMFSNLELC